MSRPYKQTRSFIRLVNARWSAESRAYHYILRNSIVGCPGDKFTIDSEMSGSKARHSTLKARATPPRKVSSRTPF